MLPQRLLDCSLLGNLYCCYGDTSGKFEKVVVSITTVPGYAGVVSL